MFVRAGSCDARTEDHLHVVEIFRLELTPTAQSVLSLELAGIFVPSSAADIVAIRAFCSVAAYEYSSRFSSVVEMTGNDFLHTHSLPFACSQFPFLSIPIPKFKPYSHYHGIPVGFPFSSRSQTRTAKQ